MRARFALMVCCIEGLRQRVVGPGVSRKEAVAELTGPAIDVVVDAPDVVSEVGGSGHQQFGELQGAGRVASDQIHRESRPRGARPTELIGQMLGALDDALDELHRLAGNIE
jgi:hypothetical protein